MSNENLYNELLDQMFPRELLLEVFTQYYGEDQREFLKKRIDNIDIVFVPKSFSSYKIKQAYIETYGGENRFDLKETIMYSLQNFAKGYYSSFVIQNLVKHQKVIESLGFDLHQIIKKSKLTGKLTIVPTEETKRLKDFVNNEIKNTKISKDDIDVDSFLEFYNKCANEKKKFGINSRIEEDKLVFDTLEDVCKDDEKRKFDNFIEIKNLDEQDKEFLFDLLESKVDLNSLDKQAGKYVVKNINKIFNTNHKSIKDILLDSRLSMFFYVLDIAKPAVKNFIVDENIKQDFISPSTNYETYMEASDYIGDNLGFYHYDEDNEYICLPISDKFTIGDSLHEANHSISLNDFNRNTGLSNQSVGLNEIVNEFLTKRAIENYNKDVTDDKKLINGECGYDIGVKIFKKFLLKYENKFKQSQLAGYSHSAEMILYNFIGGKNLDKLFEFAEFIKENNWGCFCVPINNTGIKFKDETNIADWLEEYSKNPEILDFVPKQDLDKVIKFIEMEKYLEKLIEKSKIFEDGVDEDFIIEDEEYKFNYQNIKEEALTYSQDE